MSYKKYLITIHRFRLGFGIAALVFLMHVLFPQYVLANTSQQFGVAVLEFPLNGEWLPSKDLVPTVASVYTDTTDQKIVQSPDYQVVWDRYMTITAYSSTPDQTDGSPYLAARGHVVHWGMVAANDLKIGTQVRMPDLFGDQVFTVLDRMNARYSGGWRLDVWMPVRDDAKRFGKRYTRVEIVQEEVSQ
ncbi:MAG: hypothetical protein UV70_C0005G0039 [Parcubacteria group bacterium GW2011_GWA2_43_13]|nr:MAG: hypothetical protein UV70_C0005G0039 [Parcubacteria group bacterium GW2011_GWA2_43_13]OGY71144.1 MAG: hypothetical protein A2986_03235 [Candidatus Jacksonbacteria bacterium RIFCSPLOWO2_01_FULL_44_13]HAZ16505.1 hypothetical protein [Candidatus Jacksonbacteria bacterium]